VSHYVLTVIRQPVFAGSYDGLAVPVRRVNPQQNVGLGTLTVGGLDTSPGSSPWAARRPRAFTGRSMWMAWPLGANATSLDLVRRVSDGGAGMHLDVQFPLTHQSSEP